MPLIAYDEEGNVVAVLDKLVVRDADGQPALVDFATHEPRAGSCAASGTWPARSGRRPAGPVDRPEAPGCPERPDDAAAARWGR